MIATPTVGSRPDATFIFVSLALAAPLGTGLGLSALASARGLTPPALILRAIPLHGQLQVYAFLGLFTMGVALLMWPKVLATKLVGSRLAYLSLATMVAGIALGGAWPVPGALCKTLATALFVWVLWLTRGSSDARSPLTHEQSLYLFCGTGWLILSPTLGLCSSTLGLETALWGFMGLYVAGLGLRLHPGMLGIKGIQRSCVLPSVTCWNLGIIARWIQPGWLSATLLALGVGLFLLALRPFRRSTIAPGGMPWLRIYVRLAYVWLLIALLLTMSTDVGYPMSSAARHAFATGFLLTMATGMGLRMLPAFEGRRLRWPKAPWAVLFGLTIGGFLRIFGLLVGSETQSIGAALQALGTAGFIVLILSSARIKAPAQPVADLAPQPKG